MLGNHRKGAVPRDHHGGELLGSLGLKGQQEVSTPGRRSDLQERDTAKAWSLSGERAGEITSSLLLVVPIG